MSIIMLALILGFPVQEQYEYEIELASKVEAIKRKPTIPDDLPQNTGFPVSVSQTPPGKWRTLYAGTKNCAPCQMVQQQFSILRQNGAGWVIGRDHRAHIYTLVESEFAQYKIEGVPCWIQVSEKGEELRRAIGYMDANEIAAWQARKDIVSSAAATDGKTILDQIRKYGGTSGSFSITPAAPLSVVTDDGVQVQYSRIGGSYRVSDNQVLVDLDQPLPMFDGRKWGFHYHGSMKGVEYSPPSQATINSTIGRYRINLEKVQ
jgi:hypothetical protein